MNNSVKRFRQLTKFRHFEIAWDVFWISLISFVTIHFKIGNTQLRMATASSDDNPISIANYLLSRSDYASDIYLRYVSDYGSHSVYNLIPLILIRFGLSAEFVWNLLVFSQVCLLYISLTILLRFLKVDFKFRPQFLLFVSLYQPYFWNLGGIGLDVQPYAFTLAIPLSVFILVLISAEKSKISYLAIFLLTLLHPTYGLFVLIFAITNDLIRNSILSIKKIISFALPTILLILSQGLIFTNQSLKVPYKWQDFIWGIGHLNFYNPLKSFSGNLSVVYWVYIVVLSLNAYLVLKASKNVKQQKLLLSLVYASVLGIILNHIALTFKINLISNLLGARITSLLVLFSLAILYKSVLSNQAKFQISDFYGKLFFVFPHPLFLIQQSFSKMFKSRVMTLAVFSLSLFLAYGLFVRFAHLDSFPFSNQFSFVQKFIDISTINIGSALVSTVILHRSTQILFLMLLFSLTLSIFRKKFFDIVLQHQARPRLSLLNVGQSTIFYSAVTAILLLISSVRGFAYEYQFSFNSNTWRVSQVQDLKNTQLWARTNTPENSAFIVNPNKPFLPWRTLSDRAAIPMGKVIGAYGYYDYMDKFNVDLTRYFEEFPLSQSITPERLCEFRNRFGGNYIVDSVQSNEFLNVVTIVYQNNSYYIGKINC
jgi:hypothetical protein